MCTIAKKPKPAGKGGVMATHSGRLQSHYTKKPRTRQAVAIIGPLVATACRLHLWGLALDLMALYNRRAFQAGGPPSRVEYGDGRKVVYGG